MENEIEVPSYFLCPISLEIMKDPVTVSTGITYDRESIEKWMFDEKKKTCPLTKQPLSDCTDLILTPNHTLRRLIQAWCTVNSWRGVQRIPTPKPPVDKSQITKLLRDNSPNSLKRLKSIASGSQTNKRCMEAAGAVDFLASRVIDDIDDNASQDEALSILHSLGVSEPGLKHLLCLRNGEFVESLTRVMQKGTYESRAYAVLLLKSMSRVADPVHYFHLGSDLFVELVQVLKDQVSPKASEAALQTLIQVCPWGRNRMKAVEAGAVWVLIELLLDCKERKQCELVLVLLELMCQCAEGRAELLNHAAGLAIVSKKILRVSTLANDRAARILLSISKFSATQSVVQDMLKLGVVAKLCLMLQVESGNKAKDKARQILKLHASVWRNSPCIPTTLLSSFQLLLDPQIGCSPQ